MKIDELLFITKEKRSISRQVRDIDMVLQNKQTTTLSTVTHNMKRSHQRAMSPGGVRGSFSTWNTQPPVIYIIRISLSQHLAWKANGAYIQGSQRAIQETEISLQKGSHVVLLALRPRDGGAV